MAPRATIRCVRVHNLCDQIAPDVPPTIAQDTCNSTAPISGFDMPGNDLRAYIPSPPALATCVSACCASGASGLGYCGAFIYEPSSDSKFMDCLVGQPCCYLKVAPGPLVPKNVSGGIYAVNVSASQLPVVTPALGVRSAVPLGGVGAGSVEMRADGALHEWTIVNQSPGEGLHGSRQAYHSSYRLLCLEPNSRFVQVRHSRERHIRSADAGL